MRRTAYLVAFLLLALAAGLLTLRAQRTVDVLVAAHDVRAGQQIAAGDVEIRRVHEDSVPGDALASPDAVVGQFAAWPFTGGEPVLGRMVRHARSGVALTAAITVPDGYRAIAVPVQPSGAVGGMLAPGDHVDVYATPLAGHQSTSAASRAGGSTAAPVAGDGTVVLGRDLLVLQLRSDQGQPLDASGDQSVHGLNFGVGKLGSVVIAVPADDVARYASAAVGDSIYLALSVG
ncbi:MAG TPA: Flp pilus assembly protein CpaB [Candidatus Dormibacteraeota bacterium]|jgi:Flp pilus assembly protein CpaB|nr:Flp pilus assembly protein CpaB [Candidatus Dormibacteraeota bacterium]